MAETCQICLEELLSDLSTTRCGHVYHFDCISQWLSSGSKKCPTCKQFVKPATLVKLYFSCKSVASLLVQAQKNPEHDLLDLTGETNEPGAEVHAITMWKNRFLTCQELLSDEREMRVQLQKCQLELERQIVSLKSERKALRKKSEMLFRQNWDKDNNLRAQEAARARLEKQVQQLARYKNAKDFGKTRDMEQLIRANSRDGNVNWREVASTIYDSTSFAAKEYEQLRGKYREATQKLQDAYDEADHLRELQNQSGSDGTREPPPRPQHKMRLGRTRLVLKSADRVNSAHDTVDDLVILSPSTSHRKRRKVWHTNVPGRQRRAPASVSLSTMVRNKSRSLASRVSKSARKLVGSGNALSNASQAQGRQNLATALKSFRAATHEPVPIGKTRQSKKKSSVSTQRGISSFFSKC